MEGLHEATFIWPEVDAQEVVITGTFDQWSSSMHLTKSSRGFEGKIKLPWGSRVLYKFVVDGHWRTAQSQPEEADNQGNLNNVYECPSKPEPPTVAEPNEQSSEDVKCEDKVSTTIRVSESLADTPVAEIPMAKGSQDIKGIDDFVAPTVFSEGVDSILSQTHATVLVPIVRFGQKVTSDPAGTLDEVTRSLPVSLTETFQTASKIEPAVTEIRDTVVPSESSEAQNVPGFIDQEKMDPAKEHVNSASELMAPALDTSNPVMMNKRPIATRSSAPNAVNTQCALAPPVSSLQLDNPLQSNLPASTDTNSVLTSAIAMNVADFSTILSHGPLSIPKEESIPENNAPLEASASSPADPLDNPRTLVPAEETVLPTRSQHARPSNMLDQAADIAGGFTPVHNKIDDAFTSTVVPAAMLADADIVPTITHNSLSAAAVVTSTADFTTRHDMSPVLSQEFVLTSSSNSTAETNRSTTLSPSEAAEATSLITFDSDVEALAPESPVPTAPSDRIAGLAFPETAVIFQEAALLTPSQDQILANGPAQESVEASAPTIMPTVEATTVSLAAKTDSTVDENIPVKLSNVKASTADSMTPNKPTSVSAISSHAPPDNANIDSLPSKITATNETHEVIASMATSSSASVELSALPTLHHSLSNIVGNEDPATTASPDPPLTQVDQDTTGLDIPSASGGVITNEPISVFGPTTVSDADTVPNAYNGPHESAIPEVTTRDQLCASGPTPTNPSTTSVIADILTPHIPVVNDTTEVSVSIAPEPSRRLSAVLFGSTVPEASLEAIHNPQSTTSDAPSASETNATESTVPSTRAANLFAISEGTSVKLDAKMDATSPEEKAGPSGTAPSTGTVSSMPIAHANGPSVFPTSTPVGTPEESEATRPQPLPTPNMTESITNTTPESSNFGSQRRKRLSFFSKVKTLFQSDKEERKERK